jgi:hypothetical protein
MRTEEEVDLVHGQRIDLRRDHMTLRYSLVICYNRATVSLVSILSHRSSGATASLVIPCGLVVYLVLFEQLG